MRSSVIFPPFSQKPTTADGFCDLTWQRWFSAVNEAISAMPYVFFVGAGSSIAAGQTGNLVEGLAPFMRDGDILRVFLSGHISTTATPGGTNFKLNFAGASLTSSTDTAGTAWSNIAFTLQLLARIKGSTMSASGVMVALSPSSYNPLILPLSGSTACTNSLGGNDTSIQIFNGSGTTTACDQAVLEIVRQWTT